MGFFDKLNQLVAGIGLGGENASNRPQRTQEKKGSADDSGPSQKQVQSLGVDISPVLNDPKIRKILVDHANISCQAIESVPEQYRGKVAEAVLDNFYGTLPEGQTLLAQIQTIHPMPKAEAMSIARGLSGKLTSRLDQARQEEIGITEYIWRGALPRCNHLERNGKKFKWKNPPPGGHPGQAHLCACYAEAVIDTNKIIRTAKKR